MIEQNSDSSSSSNYEQEKYENSSVNEYENTTYSETENETDSQITSSHLKRFFIRLYRIVVIKFT